jgi:hypothetical protein
MEAMTCYWVMGINTEMFALGRIRRGENRGTVYSTAYSALGRGMASSFRG